MSHPIVRRGLALLGLAAASLLASPQAQAYSRATYAPAYGNTQPQYVNESTTLFRIEGKDNAGNLVGIQHCLALGNNCNSFVPGAVNNVVVLEINLEREEVLSESCKGVPSTVPQLRCENGDLVVSLRVRQGELVVNTGPEGGAPMLDTSTASKPVRFEFLEDPTKYWNVGAYWYDSTVKANRFPAGSYKVFAYDLQRYCKPVQANPGVRFDLPAGSRTTVAIVYRGTECTIEVLSDLVSADVKVFSDSGPLVCGPQARYGTNFTICTGKFAFGKPLRLSATMPSGYVPYFNWVGGPCAYGQSDRTLCDFTPDLDREVRLTAQAAGAPPPPPSVALGVARGASSPDDGGVAKGAADVPMLQLKATPSNGTAMLQALTFSASGSGRDDLDLMMVKVVVDANGNGQVDPGETVLAQGRPSVDNGTLRLAFASPVEVRAATDLLVVADIGSDVHSASAAVWGGTTLVLAFGVLAWPKGRRRLVPVLVAVAVVFAGMSACGGGGADPVDPPVAEDPPLPPAPPAPPVLLTYRLDLTAVEATDAATPAKSLGIDALPIGGATLTVTQ